MPPVNCQVVSGVIGRHEDRSICREWIGGRQFLRGKGLFGRGWPFDNSPENIKLLLPAIPADLTNHGKVSSYCTTLALLWSAPLCCPFLFQRSYADLTYPSVNAESLRDGCLPR